MEIRLSKLAQTELEHLHNLGIELSDEEIIEIYELGKIADYGVSDFNLLAGVGCRIGSTTLHPLTIGARTWLQEDVIRYFHDDIAMQQMCYLYALANSRDVSKFQFDSSTQCKKSVVNFLKKIKYTEQELVDALNILSPPELEELEDPDSILEDLMDQFQRNVFPPNIDRMKKYLFKLKENKNTTSKHARVTPIVAILMKYFYRDIDYWLWEVSEETCVNFINEAQKLEALSKGVKETFSSDDESIKAFSKLKNKVTNIITQHEAVKEEIA